MKPIHFNLYFIKILLLFIILQIGTHIYSQEIIIKGIVTSDNKPVPDAIIQISESDRITKTITNDLGVFELQKYKAHSDTFLFSISKIGFLPFKEKINKSQLKDILFQLLKDTIRQLKEVVITENNTIHKSNKTIYKINSNEYIKNAKANVALKSLPNISITEGSILVNNRKRALIFIDGIESNLDELKRLDVKDVDKIEVISNPSASYAGDNFDAAIQIITKKKSEKFIKGEMETYAGVRLGALGIIPSLAFKTKNITFKSFYSYGTNNQNNESNLTRIENNNAFYQNSYRKVTGWQDYFSSRMKITLNSQSSINLSGNLFRYDFKGMSDGFYNSNSVIEKFIVDDTEKLNKWSLSPVYNYNLNPQSKFFVKFKYFDYRNQNQSLFIENGGAQSFNDIFSNTKESSGEIVFEKKEVKFFELPLEYSVGYKNIHRKFYFQSNDFNLNQNINSMYLDADIELNEKNSVFTSLSTDFTNNKSKNATQNYSFIFPVFSWLYQYSKKIDFKLEYSRKITRPGVNYLNSNAMFFNPGYSLSGNVNLLPQLRDLYEISLTKQFENKTSISLGLFNEFTNDAIIETFIKENNTIINTYENAGKVTTYGTNIGVNTKLFKKLSLNINAGVNYNNYISNSVNSLVKKNMGYSLNTNFNLKVLVKKKISLTLNGNFNSPNYSLVSTYKRQPLFSFNTESTFFKEKLNIRLSYFDMFGLSAKSRNDISYYNFKQTVTSNNRMTNFTISLIVNFGKTFNDRFINPIITNDDINVK